MRIKSAAKWLGVLVVLCAASAAYAVSAGTYSIQPPPGWEPLDMQQVRARTAAVSNSGTPPVYDMGFQPGNRVVMDYPYILVQTRPGHFTVDEMKASIEREAAGSSPLNSNLTSTLRATPIRVDVDHFRNRYTMNFTLNMPGVGTVDARSFGFVGRNSVVMFHCYARAKDWDKYAPLFREMVNSFQWQAGQDYQERTLVDDLRTAVVPIAIGTCIAGFFFFRKREPQFND